MVRQLIRIGHDVMDGYLEGGMEAWSRARLPMASIGTVTPQHLYQQLEGGGEPVPLDVRFTYEWRYGHVPGAEHIELGELPERSIDLSKDQSYATLCAAGIRAATVASILEQKGFNDVSVVSGGTSARERAGFPLEGGS